MCQRGAHLLLVEFEYYTAGLAVHPRVGPVIEDREGAVRLAAGVVLVGEFGAWPHLEVALFTAQPPYNLTALAVDLVGGGGVAGRDDPVTVMIHVYGVDMEVVEVLRGTHPRFEIGLVEFHVIEAVPFEEHLSGLDINLLSDPTEHRAVFWSTD